MKTAESKTTSNALMKKSNPFFSKESDGHFFESQQRCSSLALPSSVQAKLNVGSPNDPYEKEADSTADKAVQRLAEPGGHKGLSISNGQAKANLQEKCDGCDQEEKLQKKGEEEISEPDKVIRRKPIFESNAEAPDDENDIRLKCEECDKEGAVQKKENESDHSIANPDIEKQLNSSSGSGTALPENTRHQMESSIGADFSNVRIHHDANAAELSKNLHAQAFTHGKDIYFNAGKYDTSSKEGQHLLAHELTHTIQQGESKIDRKILDNAPSVQKAPAAPGASQPPEGKVDKTSSGFTITLTNFPLKRYVNPYIIPPHPVMPKGKRDTDQKKLWTDASKTYYEKFITDLIAAGNLQNEPLLRFTLKSNTKAELIGTKEQIIHEISVPFWDLGGNAVINEVEHAVDYQILGNDADNIDNLILLDKNSNGQLGRIVNGNVNAFLNRILNFYQPTFPELDGVTARKARKDPQYIITYEGFAIEPVSLGNSLISISNVKGVNTPFKPEFAEIKKAEIPPDHFLLKTNTDRTGYLLPYSPNGNNVGRFYMTTQKDSSGMLESITLDPLVNGGKFVEIKKTKSVKIVNENKVKDVFLISSQALAARMKGFIGVKYFSPVVFEEPELTPGLGMKAIGKVDPSLDFLKDNNIDISFELQDSEFSVKASISDIVKFPKPFEVTDTSLWIQISSKNGLSVGGDIGFKINKVGSGRLSMIKGAETFGVTGEFVFDSKKFEGSKVGFEYKDNKWSFKGTINVKDVTGVKEGSLTVAYDQEKITASGHATLDVPGVDKITLNASFDKDGGFLISGEALLKSMPGIKSGGKVTVSLEKPAAKSDYVLSMTGSVEPNLPKIPKLNPKLDLSYVDGLFKAEGKTDFGTEGGLISGNVTVGVTNANVEDGKIVAGQKKEISFYGNGKLTIAPVKGVSLDLFVKVDTKGVALFSADLKASVSPFPPLKPDPKSILEIDQDFPLFGIPFLSINLHMKLGASLYLEWIPLTICISGKITDKTYDELITGKFDADLCLTVQTSGKVGLKVTIGAGVSVTMAVLKGGADLNGSLSLELNAIVKGTLNAKWGEKGFKLKDGLGEAQANLELFPSLNGRVYVDLDLIVHRSNLWQRETKSVEGQHIVLYSTGIKVPFEFDDNNQLLPLNFDKISFEPKLDKDSAKDQADKAANPDGKKQSPDDLINEKKNVIRQQIRTNFQNAGKNQSYDRYSYATDLRATLLAKADPAFVSFINEVIETEFKWVELDDFDKFKNALISSKDPVAKRLARIDAFQKDYSTVPSDNFEILRSEIKSQSPDSSNSSVVQKKDLEGDPNPGNDARIKKNAAVPPRAPENAGLDDKIPKIKSGGSSPHKDANTHEDAGKAKASTPNETKPEISTPGSAIKVNEEKKPPAQQSKIEDKVESGQKKKYNLKNYREESSATSGSVKDKIKSIPARDSGHDQSSKGITPGGGGHSGSGAGAKKQTGSDQPAVPGTEKPGIVSGNAVDEQHLLVEDSATASKNQMRKTDFLRMLESEMTGHLKNILTGTGISSDHILYIQTSIAKLRENSATAIEQEIRKFEPSTAGAKTTREIIDRLLFRFIRTASDWQKTRNPSLIRDFFIGNDEGHVSRLSPEVREFTRLIQVNEHTSNGKIQKHPVAPTPVDRKTRLQIFGLGIFLGGMTLSEFNEYTTQQADWFTEPSLSEPDRKDLWKLLTKSRAENPTLSGVGDLALSQLRTVSDADWVGLTAFCEGCDSRFNTVRFTPTGLLPERIALGHLLKTLVNLAGGRVLESTMTEAQLKQIKTQNLLVPLSVYLALFKPFLEQTTDKAKKLAVGTKSEIQLLIDFVKAPGALVFLSLLGKVRNLHRFAPDALMQLQNNFQDFSHSKPLFLILYSGHDNNSAFLESKTLFENLIKDKTKLVLMLEAQESVQSIIDQVPDIAKNFGMPDKTGTNQIAQVMIAGHGSSRSVELAGAGPAVAGDVGNYHTESLDLDKNNKRAIDLLTVLMDHMDPATARIVFAGCLVGAKDISVKDAAGNIRTAVDTKNEVNNPANESLAQTTRDLAATPARGKAGMPVEGARASVALADSKSLQDAAGNLHIDYTMDPTAFGLSVVYVATGKEPEGLMRAAVEVAAVNPVIAANQLKLRLNLPATASWYDQTSRIFATEAVAGIGPGAPADIAKLNQLAAMADPFLMSVWGARSVAFFGNAVNLFPAIAANLYTQVLATPQMTAPAAGENQVGRFILELAWCMMTPARAANVITYLDTHGAIKPNDIKDQLDIAWLNSVNTSASLFPAAAAATAGRIRLALAWMKKDNANADVVAFLTTQVDHTGPRPRLLPVVIAELANPAEEDGLLNDLGQVPMVVPVGGGAPRPPANADAFPDGKGPAMNDVRIEPEVYIATVIPPAYYLNVRRQPTLAGAPFTRLKRGDTVQVMGFVHQWAAVDIKGKLGFAHSRFLSNP